MNQADHFPALLNLTCHRDFSGCDVLDNGEARWLGDRTTRSNASGVGLLTAEDKDEEGTAGEELAVLSKMTRETC